MKAIQNTDKNQVIAMFYDGYTSEFLAQHFNRSKATISMILSEHLDSIEVTESDETYINKVERILFFEIEKDAMSQEKSKLANALAYEYAHFICKTFN